MCRRSPRPGLASLLLAAFALVGLLARGVPAAQGRPSEPIALLAPGATICHTSAPLPNAPPPDVPAPTHRSDCVLCGVCQAPTQAGALIVPAPVVAAVPTALWRRIGFLSVPHRAPPKRVLTTAWPRGPPAWA